MPLRIVGQRAQEDVGPKTWPQAVVDGTHRQVNSFEASECPLHQGQALVVAHSVLGRHIEVLANLILILLPGDFIGNLDLAERDLGPPTAVATGY